MKNNKQSKMDILELDLQSNSLSNSELRDFVNLRPIIVKLPSFVGFEKGGKHSFSKGSSRNGRVGLKPLRSTESGGIVS